LFFVATCIPGNAEVMFRSRCGCELVNLVRLLLGVSAFGDVSEMDHGEMRITDVLICGLNKLFLAGGGVKYRHPNPDLNLYSPTLTLFYTLFDLQSAVHRRPRYEAEVTKMPVYSQAGVLYRFSPHMIFNYILWCSTQ